MTEPRPDHLHLVPVGDLITHETIGEDCPCGPVLEPVQRGDGSFGWLTVHHSLDGRERSEPRGKEPHHP